MLELRATWMKILEREEYSDLNCFRGKQAKFVKAREKDKQQVALGSSFFFSPHIF